nr:hypothetical protein [Acutalibacter muris]
MKDTSITKREEKCPLSFFIGIEDLAANALIEVFDGGRRFLTYREIEEYGNEVVRILNAKQEEAVLILSRNSTNDMYRDYSAFFEETEENGERGVHLKDNKSCEDLIDAFRGYLPLPLLLAFVDQRSRQVLGVVA